MPELHDLLSDEADHQQPSHNRPFTDLVQARRRRDRKVRLAGAGVVGAVAIAGVALAGTFTGAGSRTTVVGDGDPTPTTTLSGTAGVAVCSISRMDISLIWLPQPDGSLKGNLVAKNAGSDTCRLVGKPKVVVLGSDGQPRDVPIAQTLEGATESVVKPGYVATSTLAWRSWCGDNTPVGDEVQVYFGGENGLDPVSVTIQPTGGTRADGSVPHHPTCQQGTPTSMSVSYFGDAFDPAPLVPPVPGAAVTGTLELVGGPSGNAPRGVHGTVTATTADGSTQTVAVGSSGRFTLHLTSGTYTITGSSPLFGAGQYVCRAAEPVTVNGPTEGVLVACSMK